MRRQPLGRAAAHRGRSGGDPPAARRLPAANRDLHAAIARAAHNPHVEAPFVGLLNHGMRLNWICLDHFNAGDLDKHLRRACIEHDQIVRSIEKGDAAGAERLAREHTNTFRQRLKDFLSDSLASEIRMGRQIR